MAEYLVKDTSLTAIADEIRTLSGTTGTMGLDAMATNVSDANTEIDNQVELLAQAVAALEGKAGGGSGSSGGGAAVETCTVEITSNGIIHRYAVTQYTNGEIINVFANNNNTTTLTVSDAVKNSVIYLFVDGINLVSFTNATLLHQHSDDFAEKQSVVLSVG